MSANECELADWRAVGYEDGVRGRSSDVFGQYRRNCAKHEVAPDFAAYQAGRDAGLREYCQPANGYRIGSRGGEYHGVCPTDLEGGFYDSYVEGRILYDLEHAVASTTREIENRQARMKDIELELAGNTTAVFAGEMSTDERAQLIIRTKQLAEERITLANEVDQLEAKLVKQERDLTAHREQLVTQR
ncbi:MAG: DUF2799 domain-containing protein [Gammaproteobacteria bacterium]|nr:DUF2799 domain-containing protein [Gammaproteobacteria bacterium]